MAEDFAQPEVEEDPFAEDDEWLAAQVRQLCRAHRACDAKAVEVTLFYFKHRLTLTLGRHLKKYDPVWSNTYRPAGSYRWFDGLDAKPEFPAPGRVRLRGEVCWVSGQEHWYYD